MITFAQAQKYFSTILDFTWDCSVDSSKNELSFMLIPYSTIQLLSMQMLKTKFWESADNKSCRRVHTDIISIRSVHDHAFWILKGVNPEMAPLRMIMHHTVRIALAAHDEVRMSRSARVMTDWVVA